MKLMNNLSIEQRMNTEWGDKFYPEQRAEILDGARLGINAEAYANPDYTHGIMKEIKVGLLQDPSLEKYIDAFVNRKNTLVSMKDITIGRRSMKFIEACNSTLMYHFLLIENLILLK